MRFSDFIAKLDAEAMPGHHGVCFAIPNMTLVSLREKAGSDGDLTEHPGYVTLTFPMDGGAAVVTGFINDGRLETGWLFFAPRIADNGQT
jgi:hypothetical protein